MKLIILEGPDRLGKNSLLKNICDHYNYDNIMIRHFGKPPKELIQDESIKYQFGVFINESNLIHNFVRNVFRSSYYDNIIIWNRSHLGEYVYSQMFRHVDPIYVKRRLLEYERFYLNCRDSKSKFKMYLITLSADPEFILNKEDGQSFSRNLEEKTREMQLFKEVHKFSLIKSKLLIKVDDNGKFRGKEEIFNEVINFIDK